jgi:hypothetical protein
MVVMVCNWIKASRSCCHKLKLQGGFQDAPNEDMRTMMEQCIKFILIACLWCWLVV